MASGRLLPRALRLVLKALEITDLQAARDLFSAQIAAADSGRTAPVSQSSFWCRCRNLRSSALLLDLLGS